MTLTTLERIELPVEDVAIPCQGLDNPSRPCSNAATHVIRYICGCIKLACADCVRAVLAYIASCIGSIMYCDVDHSFEVYLDKISDIIVSVDKL